MIDGISHINKGFLEKSKHGWCGEIGEV